MSLWLHYESGASAPEYTLKLGLDGAPVTVADALGRFATAYASTGYSLATAGALRLSDADGKLLDAAAILPCGLPPGADAFVKADSAPTQLDADAAAAQADAAKAALAAAAHPTGGAGAGGGSQGAAVLAPMHTVATTAAAAAAGGEESRQKGVYAKAGSAIAASQAKMGENSYYYSVGRNKPGVGGGGPAATAPASAPQMVPKKVVERPASLKEQTFTSFSFLDDDAAVKVHIPLAGAGSLPEGAISCDFRERSFDLRVTSVEAGKVLRLHVPILMEEIDAENSSVKKKVSKLILVLKKADATKSWYELRKTKGVGDSEYHKIVPDSGDAITFTL